MSLLLNRKYGSRLECLYYILQSRFNKFGKEYLFKLKDFKYDKDDINNVHQYCKLLNNVVGRKCCPYLTNPLNKSMCYATQSIMSDTTKSKAVSDIGGSLEALGFIKKNVNGNKITYQITDKGEKWVNTDFFSEEWVKIALDGVLSYGVIIGFLNKIYNLPDEFSYSGLYISYPHTEELVEYKDEQGKINFIKISTDSQKDSNTRTTTRLINWCVTVGLLEPIGKIKTNPSSLPHIKYRDFINTSELTIRKFKKTNICKHIFDKKIYVDNPLSYDRLHKNVASLRENGGENLRRATLLYNENILHRRFVFVYVLNHFSKMNQPLIFNSFVKVMEKYSNLFFTNKTEANNILSSESEIADIAGIPFITDGEKLIARTIINESVLLESAPKDIINRAKTIIKEIEQK